MYTAVLLNLVLDLVVGSTQCTHPGSEPERHETASANGRFTGVFLKYVKLQCILCDDKVFYKTFI